MQEMDTPPPSHFPPEVPGLAAQPCSHQRHSAVPFCCHLQRVMGVNDEQVTMFVTLDPSVPTLRWSWAFYNVFV